jgi:hypothetical protein
MRSRLILIPLLLGILLNSIPSAQATEPDFKDFYLPIIQDLKIKPEVNLKQDSNGKNQYVTQLAVDLVLKVHHNSLAGFRVYYEGPRSTVENLCQSIQTLSGLRISIGNTEYSGNEGSLTVLPGLKSRVKEGDWFIETYSLYLPIPSNQNFFPCEGTYKLTSIILRDVAGRYKQFLSRGDGLPVPITTNQPDVVQTSFRFDSPYRAQLAEYTCPKVVGGEWNSSPLRCIDNLNPSALQITFSSSDKTAFELKAKQEAEAKAAAELKAKQEAEAKAAAELKAKQEAEAKAAALAASKKKVTITCVKGKLTKKVTAITPKCPTGFKLKK